MPTTPSRQYPYPSLAAANDPPRDLQLLAEAVDADVAALSTPSPIAPVYQEGWGDYPQVDGGIPYLGLVATRASGGLVGLSGMFSRIGAGIAATATAQHVATLPVGYRPPRITIISAFGAHDGGTYNSARIDLRPDGRIMARWITGAAWTGGGTSWVSLAGVSFVAAS